MQRGDTTTSGELGIGSPARSEGSSFGSQTDQAPVSGVLGCFLGLFAVLLTLVLPHRLLAQEDTTVVHDATLQGRVVSGMTGSPLPNFTVSLPALERGAITDTVGEFRIANLPPGKTEVRVGRLGSETQSLAIRLKARSVTEVTLLLSEAAVRMEDITVSVQRNSELDKLAGFWERERMGLGYFITPEEIARRSFQQPSDLLRRVPGVRVNTTSHGNPTVQLARKSQVCRPLYYFDGVPTQRAQIDDVNSLDLLAVEIYRGPAEIPMEFGGLSKSCGVILVWTKVGDEEDGLDI